MRDAPIRLLSESSCSPLGTVRPRWKEPLFCFNNETQSIHFLLTACFDGRVRRRSVVFQVGQAIAFHGPSVCVCPGGYDRELSLLFLPRRAAMSNTDLPVLPAELMGVIAGFADLPTMAAMALASRACAVAIRPVLEVSLQAGITLHTYYVENRAAKRCNWTGPLTSGSVTGRGTKVRLQPAAGTVIRQPVDDRTALVFNLDELDHLYFTTWNRRHFEVSHPLVSSARLHGPGEWDEWEWVHDPNGDPLVKAALAGTSSGRVVASGLGRVHVIHDYNAFWAELRRVHELARRAGVSFY